MTSYLNEDIKEIEISTDDFEEWSLQQRDETIDKTVKMNMESKSRND